MDDGPPLTQREMALVAFARELTRELGLERERHAATAQRLSQARSAKSAAVLKVGQAQDLVLPSSPRAHTDSRHHVRAARCTSNIVAAPKSELARPAQEAPASQRQVHAVANDGPD